MNVNVFIGIIMILSFLGMVWYCVKGLNLMVGFAVMATFWTALALVGNSISPNSAMEGKSFIDVLTYVYADGPAGYAKSILVNVFFGAFFGRVLVETGIASTLIRKVVELGGDKPRITMGLLCIVTAIIFMSMTGIGPVISIAVIVLPIMLSLGVPAPVAMFSFMGSIMAGIFGNIVNFKQYQTIYAGFNPAAENYTYNDYFQMGVICMVVALVVVLIVANIFMSKKAAHAWAAKSFTVSDNAPAISWISVILPVLGVVVFQIPIILGFCLAGIYALITTGKLKGTYSDICRLFAKLFTDGSIDVAPMIGFLLTLSMFNNAAAYAAPYFTAILGGFVPRSALVLALIFAILTPLGFFRGPLNLVGCGTAILAVVIAALPDAPVAFLYPLFAITTIAPQHLDITQSWVAWGFGYTKVSTKDYMKMSIPTGWIVGFICCILAFVLYGGLM
ncbi:citrate transporter [Lacrimispora sp.]|uniref:citrate transporter n=1 Tax=Lacrimispora sp. TaxID=2719234 RepID=UPI0028AAD5CD|nr:citrate transporter [Lacrimispora sp.]